MPSEQKPQPKWQLLKSLNFVVTAIFTGTVAAICYNFNEMNSNRHLQQQPPSLFGSVTMPYLVVLGLCLVYFLGFFGISFLDTDEITQSPQSFGLEKVQAVAEKEERRKQDAESSNKQAVTHKPMHDAPICAEKATCQAGDSAPSDTAAAADDGIDYASLSDDEVFALLINNTLKDHQLEKKLGDYERAVVIRRRLYERLLGKKMDLIPYSNYDYNKVFGANCEIVVGYIPIPLGIVGPLVINGDPFYVPMATTEGCLIASTNRGCKAISSSGGCFGVVLKDAITRAPCVKLPTAMRAAALKKWVEIPSNYMILEAAFNSTTNFGRLDSVEATVAGRNVYLRFCCMSGDAMGMNMVSKGCLKAMEVLQEEFPDMVLVAISGNMCTDKKPSAINWILGRGKSVVVEAVIPEKIVKSVLKCTVQDMIETNKQKNHIGSAMAGSIGGFNAHAANIVTAVYLATGQDPAQNVESSNCITIMDFADDGKSLQISVTMPSIEVGTVGGGTHLPAQAGCLDLCGVRGAAKGPNSVPGDNARKLAIIVGSAVLAGELSLMAALAANHLVRSHMQHNRKPQTSEASTPASNATAAATPTTPATPATVSADTIRRNNSLPSLSAAGTGSGSSPRESSPRETEKQ